MGKNGLIISLKENSISKIDQTSQKDYNAFKNILNDMLSRQKEKLENVENLVSLQKILDETEKVSRDNARTSE